MDPELIVDPLLTGGDWFAWWALQSTIGQANELIDVAAWYTTQSYQNSMNWADQAVAEIYRWFDNTSTALGQGTSSMLGAVTDYIEQASYDLYQTSRQALDAAASGLGRALQTIQDMTVIALDKVGAFMDTLHSWLGAIASNMIDGVKWLIEQSIGMTRNLADAALKLLESTAKATIASIDKAVDVLVDHAVKLQEKAFETMTQAYEKLYANSESIISTMTEKIGDLRGAFGDAADKLAAALEKSAGEVFPDLSDVFAPLIKVVASQLTPEQHNGLLSMLDQFSHGPWSAEMMKSFFGEGWQTLAPGGGVGAMIFFALAAVGGIGMFVVQAANIQSQKLAQGLAVEYPWQAMPPDQAAQAWLKGWWGLDAAKFEIQKSGYTEADAEAMCRNMTGPPGLGELMDGWRRTLIRDEQFDKGMQALGIGEQWKPMIRAMKESLPGVSDVERMAVREAFTPSVIQKFNLLAEFPSEFAEHLEKLGFSRYWAERFWITHWVLPSLTMAFEMFQRGIIGEEEINLLLKTQDVSPHWRPLLIKLAYNPLTRVDVRRMHKVGVLGEPEVYDAYLKLGYSPENARHLTDFTLKLNAAEETIGEDDLGKLTRTSIINFYDDGLVDRDTAFTLLTKSGITPQAAGLYLDQVDFEDQSRERKTETALVLEKARAGLLTFEAAQDALNGLGLSTLEVEKALTTLVRERNTKTKIPTRAEGETFFTKGLISETDYRDLLSTLGYSERWARVYMEKAKAKTGGDEE